jgi:hypothetical protein
MDAVTSKLSDGQVNQFQRDGFLAIQQIISRHELERLRVIYDRLFEASGLDGVTFHLGGERNEDGTYLPQILEPSKYAPELIESEFYVNAQRIAEQVLGGELNDRYGEHMIYKPPLHGSETPWHQDQTHQNPNLRYRNINFWMSLDATSVDSGCMQYVPGSHSRDVIFEHPDKHVAEAVSCPIPAGGCTMHASYTLHYSAPNTSLTPRRAYILIFRAPALPREEPILVV